MAIEPTRAIKIFFSYAHEDKKLREELDKHLGALKRSGLIVTWHDHAFEGGTQWEDEINNRLNTADLILLLISHHFIDSDYCYGREMSRALERHNAGEARVIPIILSPVVWEDTPLKKLNALPREGKPITGWRNRNSAFMQVVQDIREIVKTLVSQQEMVYQTQQKQRKETIDTHEAVKLFHQLMKADADRQLRIMYLVGDTNMGKSHLLKKVFPVLAQHEYQARCIIFDMRNPIHSISDILHMAYEQLGAKNCSNYYNTMQEISHSTKLEGNLSLILTNYASRNTSTILLNDTHTMDDRLTTQLLLDFSKLNDKPLILFFDTVDIATEQIQLWLTKTFLAKLSLLPHVRVFVASRTLLEAPSDYIDLVQTHQLKAVQDEEEYITYCQGLNIALLEQEVRTLARDFNYTPGLFANYLLSTVGMQGT